MCVCGVGVRNKQKVFMQDLQMLEHIELFKLQTKQFLLILFLWRWPKAPIISHKVDAIKECISYAHWKCRGSYTTDYIACLHALFNERANMYFRVFCRFLGSWHLIATR